METILLDCRLRSVSLESVTSTGKVRIGDPRTFASFYETHFAVVFGYARRFTGRDESFCLDVVQETFLKAMKRMKSFPTQEDAGRWLRSVTRSAALDLLRRESRRTAREMRAGEGQPAPITTTATNEEQDWLMKEIADLADSDRALLSARFADGTTLSRESRMRGISIHAAHGRVRRLLDALRAKALERFSHD